MQKLRMIILFSSHGSVSGSIRFYGYESFSCFHCARRCTVSIDIQERAGQSQRAAAEKDMDRAGITSFVTDLTRCHLLIIVDEKEALAAIGLGMCSKRPKLRLRS